MFTGMKYKKTILIYSSVILVIMIGVGIYSLIFERTKSNITESSSTETVKTARVMANGDILIHNGLYGTAEQADGSYDFKPFFEYAKDWI